MHNESVSWIMGDGQTPWSICYYNPVSGKSVLSLKYTEKMFTQRTHAEPMLVEISTEAVTEITKNTYDNHCLYKLYRVILLHVL